MEILPLDSIKPSKPIFDEAKPGNLYRMRRWLSSNRHLTKNACDACRSAKLKCQDSRPCKRCIQKGMDCTNPPSKRRAYTPPDAEDSDFLSNISSAAPAMRAVGVIQRSDDPSITSPVELMGADSSDSYPRSSFQTWFEEALDHVEGLKRMKKTG
ncbi:hypothetical protein GUITHDRAFT_150214 [Guillardia theta CCMP2712]|uniref:Zn(2)-C6 fungal-type domain-containing protein n=1 Tax=Guillardia theta (strain CCMP2712) TaxID=905079 RepID=L1JZK0_GUITC|nr:hypothetical protein GUITHDRAFT_150214 [Guillardia theta CCMP2712]EKX53543.1 hypothetical protein GUITHDRAFT_150214 [Guillardia theta CCMP2712]|eukprot:XP_005840523.1 hypothetical protein GUITHDRAFT_150214 [Guillardia theta CCMP2712]